ncbi:helix-turn-helix domain-containing protein [Thiobacillus thioparus]|jgi:hypothetical protein|uniref:helix-turn-helix domain-containing protein n=1 Tax=Thiobacillus thioparus TaxID=931 RepID=UPI00035F183E|nr:LysR family transcriptional regulator [Thiobacillus thioparus]
MIFFLTAVVEYGGVIKAAERLHLSQPSVSTGLKALEQTLGQSRSSTVPSQPTGRFA